MSQTILDVGICPMKGFPTTFEKKKNPERNSWGYCVRKKELLLEF